MSPTSSAMWLKPTARAFFASGIGLSNSLSRLAMPAAESESGEGHSRDALLQSQPQR